MKCFSIFSWLTAFALLASACQTSSVVTDNTALGRVKAAVSAYQSGNGNSFEEQLSQTERRTSAQCPDRLQFGCLQLAYKNFAAAQHTVVQSPASFTFIPYDKQTTPDVKMVLVEGQGGGNPAVVSCQVFFVITNGSTWLIDNFDEPAAITCQQRSEDLTANLFGPAPTLTPANP